MYETQKIYIRNPESSCGKSGQCHACVVREKFNFSCASVLFLSLCYNIILKILLCIDTDPIRVKWDTTTARGNLNTAFCSKVVKCVRHPLGHSLNKYKWAAICNHTNAENSREKEGKKNKNVALNIDRNTTNNPIILIISGYCHNNFVSNLFICLCFWESVILIYWYICTLFRRIKAMGAVGNVRISESIEIK